MDFSLLMTWLLIVPLPPALPPLDDLVLFPRQEYATWGLAVATAHVGWCEERTATAPEGSDLRFRWHERQREARQTRGVWRLLVAARNEVTETPTRRQYLDDLREQLGPAAYYRGAMPPPLPSWIIGRVLAPSPRQAVVAGK